MAWRGDYGGWRPYVSVARRRAQASRFAARLAKKEKRTLCPISIPGRKIATSFWGQAWCENLERYSDFENRLPRGRTYARNGSIIDLQIRRGKVQAIVSGSEIYRVTVEIKTLSKSVWKRIEKDCARSIDSLLDLLQGRFEQGIMQRLTQPKDGLFPQPSEIEMACTCPDWAVLCKHVAAVLYGVGSRLDAAPDLLFTLRDVDHLELVRRAVTAENLEQSLAPKGSDALAGSDLGELFGIELDTAGSNGAAAATKHRSRRKRAVEPEPTGQRTAKGRRKRAAKVRATKGSPTKAKTNQKKKVKKKAATKTALPAAARKKRSATLAGRRKKARLRTGHIRKGIL